MCAALVMGAALPCVALAQEGAATLHDEPPAPVPGDIATVYASDDAQWRTVEFGSQAFLADGATRTLSNLEIHTTRLAAGATSHAPHRHANEEIMVLIEGSLEVYVNGVTEEVGPGSVMVFLANDWHGLRNIGDGDALYQVINISPAPAQ
jgi:XRE family transcriptional regulator, regulator of sulfur utilization